MCCRRGRHCRHDGRASTGAGGPKSSGGGGSTRGRQVTGRSTAKITMQHGLIYRHLIDTLGTEKARQYANANETGFRYIERLDRRPRYRVRLTRRKMRSSTSVPIAASGRNWIRRHKRREALAWMQKWSRRRHCHLRREGPYGSASGAIQPGQIFDCCCVGGHHSRGQRLRTDARQGHRARLALAVCRRRMAKSPPTMSSSRPTFL